MGEWDDVVDRVVTTLKEPVTIDPGLNARVMAEISRMPAPRPSPAGLRSLFDWIRRPRTIVLSPLSGLAMAAAVIGALLAGNRLLAPSVPAVTETAAVAGPTVIQFVLVAPGAATVSLVGDFNDWNMAATPLMRDQGEGMWSVTIPLTTGRYRYSFVVDGDTWLRDPRGARALDDDFGRPNSVLTIGEA